MAIPKRVSKTSSCQSRGVEQRQGASAAASSSREKMGAEPAPECVTSGMTSYFSTKIGGLQREVRDKTLNLQRLTAQRNELNARVRELRAGPASPSKERGGGGTVNARRP